MSEHLSSERRLADLVSAYADLARIDVDPMAMTRLAAAAPRRALRFGFGFVPAGLWVALLLMALLVSIAAGALVAGGRDVPVDLPAMRVDAELPPTPVGPIGLPPVGATPSKPETGELVLHFWGPNPGGYGRIRVWVYTDGRLIWLPEGGLLREAAIAPWSRYFERRLTPHGVELMRSEVLSISELDDQQPAAGITVPFPRYLGLEVRNEGRLVDVERATSVTDLDRLDARLSDPTSWLPASAWEDAGIKAYVPSHYAVCYYDPSQEKLASPLFLTLLPTPAKVVLRGKDWTQEDGAPHGGCSDVTTEEARTIDDAFKRVGLPRAGLSYTLEYEFEAPGPSKGSVWMTFEPYLPHGETTCAGCG